MRRYVRAHIWDCSRAVPGLVTHVLLNPLPSTPFPRMGWDSFFNRAYLAYWNDVGRGKVEGPPAGGQRRNPFGQAVKVIPHNTIMAGLLRCLLTAPCDPPDLTGCGSTIIINMTLL